MRLTQSLRWRMQFWYGLLLAAALAGFGVMAHRQQKNSDLKRIDFALEREATAMLGELREILRGLDYLHRKKVKALIAELAAENPKIRGNMFAAMGNVKPSHLIDPALRELAGLDGITGEARGDDDSLLALG